MLNHILNIKWGAKSLVALYISVISGIIVAFQYDLKEPYYSSGTLELVVPYGAFWRSVHFFSSQVFVIFLCVHLAVIIADNRLDSTKPGNQRMIGEKPRPGNRTGYWIKLTLSVPLAILLLFTGYILRADSTGEAAGLIAENITLTLPLFGKWINEIMFNISATGMQVVHVNHLIGLGVIGGIVSWSHLRKYRISFKDELPVSISILAGSLFFYAPLDPFKLGSFHISGPWFFVGIQELLRYVQPFWGGIMFPLAGLILMCFLVVENRPRRTINWLFLAWLASYTTLTTIGLVR